MAYIDEIECTSCGSCLDDGCPVDAIREGDGYTINEDDCIDCGYCLELCPMEAIKMR